MARADERWADGVRRARSLGGANLVGARPLRALLDVELDALAAGQTVEIERSFEAVPMEEVFLLVLGLDEPESAV